MKKKSADKIDINKSTRRKKIILKYHVFIIVGYLITQIAILSAKMLNLVTVEYWQIGIFTTVAVGSSLFFMFLIYVKKNVTTLYAMIITIAEFICWLALYTIWVYMSNEMRVMALFFAFMPLTFLLSSLTFVQALFISLVAAAIQIGVSFYAITIRLQTGSIEREIFFTFCFLPAALFMVYLSGMFRKQREQVRLVKKQIEEARDALWGEMQLAKKLQMVLLPVKPEIAGFEIAAYMAPADEVGGDYYDVINVENKDWIIIGDVSGHGVPAGLVMMMVQTSIKVTLARNPDIPPCELLTVINGVIAENIMKLGEMKYMTITVLSVFEEGRFHFSGLHQDIMIYRNAQKDVEIVATNGIWIGIMENIKGMVDDAHLALNVGDIMLLFTDGITEAWEKTSIKDKRDPLTQMFGENKLIEVLKQNGTRSPNDIKTAILDSLKDYNCLDDVTMVVIKRI